MGFSAGITMMADALEIALTRMVLFRAVSMELRGEVRVW
jgi:hypothetical protein